MDLRSGVTLLPAHVTVREHRTELAGGPEEPARAQPSVLTLPDL